MKFVACVVALSAVLTVVGKVVLTYHPMMLLAEHVSSLVK